MYKIRKANDSVEFYDPVTGEKAELKLDEYWAVSDGFILKIYRELRSAESLCEFKEAESEEQ